MVSTEESDIRGGSLTYFRFQIAYLFLILATPFLVQAAETQSTPNFLEQLVPVKIPIVSQVAQQIPNIVSSAAQLFTPKSRRSVDVQPTQPDALVIPFTNKYLDYPAVKTPDFPYPYPYHLEQFVLFAAPSLPKLTLREIYNQNYYQYPQLVYYLSKNPEIHTQTQPVAEKNSQQGGQVEQVAPQ